MYLSSRQLPTEDSGDREPHLENHLPADHDAISTFFYAPPFVLVFNVNSSVCLGQNFTFHCSAEPNNYGIQLTLLKLGKHVEPADLESRLHPEGSHPTPSTSLIDSLTEEREGGRHATSLQNIPWEQEYESRQDIHYTVNLNQTGFEGGYLCIASVVGMDAARWSYMHLRVLDCGTAHGDSVQATGISFLLNPVVISCLILFVLLPLCLTVFLVLNLRARRNILASSEWKPGPLNAFSTPVDSTVIREPNLLYHWTDTQKLLLGTATTAEVVKRPTSLAANKFAVGPPVPPSRVSLSPSTDLGVELTSSDLGHTITPGGSGGFTESSSVALTRFDPVHWLRLPSGGYGFAENPSAMSPGYHCGRRSLVSDGTDSRQRQFGVGTVAGGLPRRYSVDSDLSPVKRYKGETTSSSVPSSNSYMLLRPGTEMTGGAGGCDVATSTDHRKLCVPLVIIHMDPNKRPGQSYRESASVNNITSGGYKLPVDAKWEVRREYVRLGQRIGAGAFGVVFVGSVKDGTRVLPGLRRRSLHRGQPMTAREPAKEATEVTVAVKTLRDNFTEQDLADLVREMEILKQFDPHPHVVQLYGVCSQNGPLQVLVEFAPYGNLRDFLIVRRPSEVTYGPLHKDKGGGPLLCITPRQLLDFGLQVARGMDYLSRLHIVHRDLAARNVLIGESYVAKIADFGLTRTACDYYRKCSDGRLPIKWMAPESIFDRRYTTKSDVWSFGILLWEIFSYGSTPYPAHSAESLLRALRSGLRNERPLVASTEVYSLMLACWETVPEKRPSFQVLSALLSELAPREQQGATGAAAVAAAASTGSVPGSADERLHGNRSADSSVGSTVYLTLKAGKLHLEASSVCVGSCESTLLLTPSAAAPTCLSPSSASSSSSSSSASSTSVAAAAASVAVAVAAATTNQASDRAWNSQAHLQVGTSAGGQSLSRQIQAPPTSGSWRVPTISQQCGFPTSTCYAPYAHIGCALPMQWERFSPTTFSSLPLFPVSNRTSSALDIEPQGTIETTSSPTAGCW
uniref:Fibroblast growth factor receptor 2 n=1 Tax=Schistocephalus solidus TaxID=70667 RepID=A0A0X3PAB5_SCHSO